MCETQLASRCPQPSLLGVRNDAKAFPATTAAFLSSLPKRRPNLFPCCTGQRVSTSATTWLKLHREEHLSPKLPSSVLPRPSLRPSAHVDHQVLKIHILPLQADQFATTK